MSAVAEQNELALAQKALGALSEQTSAELDYMLDYGSQQGRPTFYGIRGVSGRRARYQIARAVEAFRLFGAADARDHIQKAVDILRADPRPPPILARRRGALCARLEDMISYLDRYMQAVDEARDRARRAEGERFPRNEERRLRLSRWAACVEVACDLLDKFAPGMLERHGVLPERISSSTLALLLTDMRVDVYSAGYTRSGEFNHLVARATTALGRRNYAEAWLRLEEAVALLPLEREDPD